MLLFFLTYNSRLSYTPISYRAFLSVYQFLINHFGKLLLEACMPQIGQTVTHYRIVEKIGQGGMGEVYLADDTTLDRRVALKFLSEAFTSDPERMARFEREAKLLASLNHPNIAGIYGLEEADGNRFLVLEYVEGETLQARLKKGALPLEDALALCRQIAEGLEAAHEKGVIHRDLKPGNVMITAEEKVKILDFGLAKALADESQGVDPADSPTITAAMTQPGVVLGTAAYMSPEQAKGKSVDKRADIWAFGCILYECLTGKRAFEGETVTETLAAVIKEEPNIEGVPAKARLLLRHCLVKDRKNRLRDIGDAMAWIRHIPETVEPESLPVKRPFFAWAVAAVFIIALAALSFIYVRNSDVSDDKPTHLHFMPSLSLAPEGSFAISPDGRYLAFAAINSNGIKSLWVRDFHTNEARPLPGTEADYIPPVFWSPDSRFIAFTLPTDAKLKKIDINGGPPRNICDLPHYAVGGSWNRDGEIILGMIGVGLLGVSADGKVSFLVRPKQEFKETSYLFPVFLPDGKHFLFTIMGGNPEENGIYVGSLDRKPEEQNPKQLLKTSCGAIYIPSQNSVPGRLLFMQQDALMAQSFDEKSLEMVGEPGQVAENIRSYMAFGFFSASMNGTLVYTSGRAGLTKIMWYDKQGNVLGKAGESAQYWGLSLSPDNERAAISWFKPSLTVAMVDIWILDFTRDNQTRFTYGAGPNYNPVWSPDGNQIVFSSTDYYLYQIHASGGGEAKLLFESSEGQNANCFSRDSRLLLFTSINPETRADLWVLPLEDEGKEYSILKTKYNEFDGQFSPDMNWVAYTSDESGRNEVYVRRFFRGSGGVVSTDEEKHRISTQGGIGPRWRGDGRELFYRASNGDVIAVEITPGTSFRIGASKTLFKAPVSIPKMATSYISFYWDVSEDGSRFFLPTPVEESLSSPFNVILNWSSLIEQ